VTARRRPYRRRPAGVPAAVLVAVLAVPLAVLVAVDVLAHVWPLLVAAAAAGGWLAARRRYAPILSPRPVLDPAAWAPPDAATRQAQAAEAERARLAAEVARLRAAVADAQASAAAAWDAAAEVAPRCRFCRAPLDVDGQCPASCDDWPPEVAGRARAALLADPRSGARPLGGAR
jgi:hypothetical protein